MTQTAKPRGRAARRRKQVGSGPGVDVTILQCVALLLSRSLSIESLAAELGLGWRSAYRYLSILKRFGCALEMDTSSRYRITRPLRPNRKFDPTVRPAGLSGRRAEWTGVPSELLLQCAALLSFKRLTANQLEDRLGRSPRSIQRYLKALRDFGAQLRVDSKGRYFLASPLRPRRN